MFIPSVPADTSRSDVDRLSFVRPVLPSGERLFAAVSAFGLPGSRRRRRRHLSLASNLLLLLLPLPLPLLLLPSVCLPRFLPFPPFFLLLLS